MFDSVFIGMSGLQSFATGLKVISNNVANLNTPGFKSSDAVFSDLFYQSGGTGTGAPGSQFAAFGTGVASTQTFINFKAGDTRQTGNPLDMSLGGDGFFVIKDAKEETLTYSRAAQFEFDKDGNLVSRTDGKQVMGLGSGGQLSPISLNGLRINTPKATSVIKLSGNLSSSSTDTTIDSIKVIDAIGGEHVLKLNFKPKANAAGTFTVSVLDGTTEVGTGEITFIGGIPQAGADSFTFSYAPTGASALSLKVDLSSGVTSFETGSTSTLAVSSTDGHAVGSLSAVTFDAKGVLSVTYTNGEKATGAQLALAVFDTNQGLVQRGNGEFTEPNNTLVHYGVAGAGRFGSITSNQVEVSNVDLSSEFSNLIVTQRGYQASSRVVSTANEMLQELFDMKGHR